MPSVNINFSDVESFEPLPEGEYGVEIEKVEVRMNKAGDGLYLNWELVVIDGDYENRRLWMITSLKDTALFRLKQVFEELAVLDADDDEMEIEYDDDIEPSQKEGPALLYPEVDGLEATALVKNEMYDGREKNRVDGLYLDSPATKKRKKTTKKTTKRSADESRGTKSRRNGRRDPDEDDDDEDDDDEEEEAPRRRASKSSRSSSATKSSGRRRRMR